MEKELQFSRNDFRGGMNRLDDSSKLLENQYPIAVNARTRYNVVEPIRSPLRQAQGLPDGLHQGVYAAGAIVLVFIAGKAYYKDFSNPASNYVQVAGFQMDANVANIFVEFVPASTINYIRQAGSNPNAAISLGAQTAGSPQCAVVQDGINQPWIIESNGVARISKNYNEWTTNNREYIPIGRQMYYSGEGVLYIVSPDGGFIYRSVTGRPLDFVVAIDNTGNKAGDATVTSHSVDFGAITCIRGLNTDQSAIFVSTAYRSYMVIPDFTDTLFGEPKFSNVPLFAAGALNQFSFIELLGDSAFITFSGMRSFNAVLQLKNEGKNAPFSAQISTFVAGIIQETSCAINSDDYALFFVKTIHGDCILVFDTLKAQWVAIDRLAGISGVKQFAEMKILGTRKLFFITAAGLYEYYGGSTFEEIGFYLGDFASGDAEVQHKPLNLYLIFSEPVEFGLVRAKIFSDRLLGKTYYKYLESVAALAEPLAFPFGTQTADRLKIVKFDIGRERTGFKLGCYLTWAFNAKLTHAKFTSTTQENTEQQAAQLTQSLANIIGVYNGNVKITSIAELNALPVGHQVRIIGANLNSMLTVRFGIREFPVTYLEGGEALSDFIEAQGYAVVGQPSELLFTWNGVALSAIADIMPALVSDTGVVTIFESVVLTA